MHQDSLSSTSLMTDALGNQLGNTVKYLPFGETRATIDIPTDKLFTGQRLDQTGLYYYNARYYDPTIGRFISPDIVIPNPANPQCFNRYSYCLNNPLKYTDPSGHDPYWDLIHEGEKKYQEYNNSVAEIAQFAQFSQSTSQILAWENWMASQNLDDGISETITNATGVAIAAMSYIFVDPKRVQHIFRFKEGHLTENTPTNRYLLEECANDINNRQGVNKDGNTVYAKRNSYGKQTWTYVRDGKIIDGGVNEDLGCLILPLVNGYPQRSFHNYRLA